MKKRTLSAIFIIIATAQSFCFASEINFELKLEKEKIYQGKQTELKAIFYGSPDIPAPEIPFISGLSFKYLKSDKKESAAGLGAPSVTHIYRVAALRAGSFDIGPIIFNYNSDRYTTNPVKLIVEKEENLFGHPGIISEKSGDISNHIYLALDLPKDNIFVNEELPFRVMLFSDWLDLENILLQQKPSKNLIVRKFSGKIISNTEKNGVKYVILEYKSSLSAVTSGMYQLNPVEATLEVALPKESAGAPAELLNANKEFYDKFIGSARVRGLTLETPPFTVTANEIPAENRPDNFRGAVGKFNFDIKVSSTNLKIGETLTLTMSLNGTGNFNTAALPAIVSVKGARVYEPKVIKGKDSILSKQTVKAESGEFSEIPQASFSFFDPDIRKFVTISKGPITIKIEGYENKPVLKETRPNTGRILTIVPLKESPGLLSRYDMRFYRDKIFILLGIMPILAVLAASIIKKRIEFLSANPRYAAMLRASKKARMRVLKAENLLAQGKSPEFYTMIFGIVQGYLGERAIIPEAGVTAKILDDMTDFEISPDMREKIKRIFSECYMAKYTSTNPGREDMKKTLEEIKYVIDELDRKEFKS